jgi:hypothetical protein
MDQTPLVDGVRRTLTAARNEEWSLIDELDLAEREAIGTEETPSIKELVGRAAARRRQAVDELRQVAAGQPAGGCADPGVAVTGSWAEVHLEAQRAMADLHEALRSVTEEQLAAEPGDPRDHPQYVWRDVFIAGARAPMGEYAEYFAWTGRPETAIAIHRRLYVAVRATSLPTKATSDVSYDLACALARNGRGDEAMTYLPDAFTTNDLEAVPVLKSWAQQDPDLASLREREDFRRLVTV